MRSDEARADRTIAVAVAVGLAAARLLRRDRRALRPPARRRPRGRGRAARRDGHHRPAHRAAQPPRVPRGPRARAAARRPHRRRRWRSCSSTSTTSRPSTTRTATRPATSACRRSPTRSAPRGAAADFAYRVGGDEFAVILPDARAWGALEFAQRLREATQAGDHGGPFTATAGIAEALALRSKDELVREADLALIGAKRIHQDVAIYGPDLEPGAAAARARTSTTPHAGQRARPRGRRQGLLHAQPLPDGVAAVRG